MLHWNLICISHICYFADVAIGVMLCVWLFNVQPIEWEFVNNRNNDNNVCLRCFLDLYRSDIRCSFVVFFYFTWMNEPTDYPAVPCSTSEASGAVAVCHMLLSQKKEIKQVVSYETRVLKTRLQFVHSGLTWKEKSALSFVCDEANTPRSGFTVKYKYLENKLQTQNMLCENQLD